MNIRFTNCNGEFIEIDNVPNDDEIIDYDELFDGMPESEINFIQSSTKQEEIDSGGNLL